MIDSHIELVLQDMANKWRSRLTDNDYQAIRNVLQSEGTNVPNAAHLLRDGVLLRDGSQPADKQLRIAPWAESLMRAYDKRTQTGGSRPISDRR
ncbi:MAG: hypothetical protein ACLQNE_15245 [Thermoguttaceae bacterium]